MDEKCICKLESYAERKAHREVEINNNPDGTGGNVQTGENFKTSDNFQTGDNFQ